MVDNPYLGHPAPSVADAGAMGFLRGSGSLQVVETAPQQ